MCDEDPKQYPPVEPDVWFTPARRNYGMSCCSCGLVHRIDHRIYKGEIQWRVRRDNRATGQLRRHREYPCIPSI